MGRVRALTIALVVLTAAAASLQFPRAVTHLHAAPDTDDRTSACTAVVTRTLAPDSIRECESSTVTLQVRPACPPTGLHAVLMLATGWCFPTDALYRAWVDEAIGSLGMGNNSQVKVGVVWFDNHRAEIKLRLTNDAKRVRALNNNPLRCYTDEDPWHDCYSCAASAAKTILRQGEAEQPRRTAAIVVSVYPWLPPGRDEFGRGAGMIRGYNNSLLAWGCPWPETDDCTWMGTWRSASPGWFFGGPSPSRFGTALSGLVAGTRTGQLAGLSLAEPVPRDVEMISGSVTPGLAVLDPSGRSINWELAAPISPALTLTYAVRPLGDLPLPRAVSFAGASALLTDTHLLSRSVPVPEGVLTVTGSCATATPVPTPSPTASRTPTASPTPPNPTATRTATATVTRERTRSPEPAFLPVLLREHVCQPEKQRADVALVVDASSSMEAQVAPGTSKLDAALLAVRVLLDQMRFEAGDQAAVVAFDGEALVLQQLTADRSALERALAGIRTGRQSRMHLGVQAARMELASARHRAGSVPAMVVLTDGRANPEGPEWAVAEARMAKDVGITVFTIGLGTDLDSAALEQMASRPDYFYTTPRAEDLAAIYGDIARAIGCPPDTYWSGR
jgi:Mg-chelatase subunit ChlD